MTICDELRLVAPDCDGYERLIIMWVSGPGPMGAGGGATLKDHKLPFCSGICPDLHSRLSNKLLLSKQ